jgi:PAS domain S-box-containing protein
MKRRGWLVYLVGGYLLLMLWAAVPPLKVGPVFNVIALSSPIAIVIAVRMHHPELRAPWYLFALGMTFFVMGDVITYNYERLFGAELPYPSVGDLAYLAVYPCLIAGLMLLIRRRSPGRDRESLIDSLIVAIGFGALWWVFLMSPTAHDSSSSWLQRVVSVSYPFMDLMLLTAIIRLAIGAGKRPPAFVLMGTAALALLSTDFVYAYISAQGIVYDQSGYLEAGWATFYLFWAAAALHPSMRQLEEASEPRELKRPKRRLYLLAGASLIAPSVMLLQALRGESIDAPVLAACSAVLFILVLVRLNGLMVDITEHRRTERQLREAETKYRTLVEGLPAVVYIAEFGEEGPWLYVSPQIESVLGYSQEEFMSGVRVWRDRIVPEDRERAIEAELQLLNGQRRMQVEYRILALDGRQLWIREEAEALEGEGGDPEYLQGVMYDVTEQKRAEERLRQALATEQEASSRLLALHEMQNSFLQAVSHDLRTPLTTILGNALTLERSGESLDPADRADLARRMASNARKLHRLLTDLLDLDRMARTGVEPNRSQVDLTEMAARIAQECAEEDHPIALVAGDPVTARVDPTQVERIIENLVMNAVRYTPPHTRIWVSARRYRDGVLLIVEDEGPGVREDLRAAIFEPFRQGEQTVTHSPGVGIGLSLVARFAEMHGGRAWVEDRQGGGASFCVYLPESTPGRSEARSGHGAEPEAAPLGEAVTGLGDAVTGLGKAVAQTGR